MKEKLEVRKLPTKTKIIFFILLGLSIGVFLLTQNSKKMEATNILHELGIKDISGIKVIKKSEVEDKVTRIQGYRYFVKFKNNKTNKYCEGFLLKDFKRKVAKDLKCQ